MNDNAIFNISYNNGLKEANIKLNQNQRYIKAFKNICLDIAVIEIIDEDNISQNCYLYPQIEGRIKDELINKNIYIPHYIEGEDLKFSKGMIKEINKYEFIYLVNIEYNLQGSPIFLENNYDVMGICKENNKCNKENSAIFIYPIINIIEEDIRKRRNDGKYINGKFIYKDGKYYLGEFKNNLPNGKGIKYYKNGNILYEGDFINGKFEGNGKLIYDNGNYFIGQFKNGLRNGKGTIYYSNGNIMYDGDWINNKAEGNGKYICENGEYYIGQWKNGLRNGKGTMYYSNGNIKYDGDWINDNFIGN